VTRLAAKARKGKAKSADQDTVDLVRVLEEFRALWAEAADAEPAIRLRVHGKIVQAIEKLKRQVRDELTPKDQGLPSYPLFGGQLPLESGGISGPPPAPRTPRFLAEPVLRLYDKDLADQALVAIPESSRFSEVDAFREHLSRTLPFNAESTRRRAAKYLTGRYFPCGIIHDDLARFASASAGRPWLGEVLFYLTCRVEKIVASVADEVIWPSLAEGSLNRSRITDFVKAQVPNWSPNSVKDIGAAIVRTYERLGIGSATKTRLSVASRSGSLPSFAYILHLEFPDPGMFAFEKLHQGPMRKWLLWDREWMVRQLYACGEAGLIAKVSEIDGARQFTTKYTLNEAVGPILSLIP